MKDIRSSPTHEVSRTSSLENKSFNPNKRIDVNRRPEVTVNSGHDVNKRLEKVENKLGPNGGSYYEVKKYSNGATHEVHHMPADTVSSLERNDGPAIKMEVRDHRQTASFGNSREAQEYRIKQKMLIDNGRFAEAYKMDVNDIRGKFGGKYDDAISQANIYMRKLQAGGKI